MRPLAPPDTVGRHDPNSQQTQERLRARNRPSGDNRRVLHRDRHLHCIARAPRCRIREVLPNGMRLIIQEHRAADTSAIISGLGSAGATRRRTSWGSRTSSEHMLFKGTDDAAPRASSSARSKRWAAAPTRGRPSTTPSIYSLLPAAAHACRAIADCSRTWRQLQPSTRRSSTPRARGGLRGGAAQRGQPALVAGPPALQPALRRAIPTGGRAGHAATTCGRATQEQLRGFYTRYYVPENMTLVVVGPVEPGGGARGRGRAPSAHAGRPLHAPGAARAGAARRRRAPDGGAPGATGPARARRGWRRRSDDPDMARGGLLEPHPRAAREARASTRRCASAQRLVSSISELLRALQGAGAHRRHRASSRPGRWRRSSAASWPRSRASRTTASPPDELARAITAFGGRARVLDARPSRASPSRTAAPRPPGTWRTSAPTWTACAR